MLARQGLVAQDEGVDDPYLTGTCRWWHLSEPSPELLAVESALTAGKPGVAVDLGCGLGTEIGYLAARGWCGLGVDLSVAALTRARTSHPGAAFARADVRSLPLATGSVDLMVDRGCFHYLGPDGRLGYAREAGRVLRPGGRLLLRLCLNSAGQPNGLDEGTIHATFADWRTAAVERMELVSDTRTMPAISAILVRPTR